jgi:hypothetical protein
MANGYPALNAVVLGQRQKAYLASPVGNGPQIAGTVSSVASNAASAQPQLITFSWTILITLAGLGVLYFKVLS